MGEYADSLKKKNSTKARDGVEVAREAAAKAKAEAKRRADAAKAQEKRDAARSKGRNSPISSPYPTYTPPTVTPSPGPTQVVTNNGGNNNGGGGTKDQVTPPEVVSTPQSSATEVKILDPNIYTAYKAEIARLTLKLVNRAKNLLLSYDFSSIDRIAEYQIEADNGARNTDVISTPQVPESPSTSVLTAQDTAVALINEISNKISDNVPLATKLDLFGSDVNGTFTPRKVGISNGISNYDLRFVVNNVSPEIKNIIIRCYEIS